MTNDQILLLKNKVADLPQGNITYKTIKGNRYPYLQWTESGNQRSRIVKPDELESLTAQIKERKNLEAVLKDQNIDTSGIVHEFVTEIKTGESLKAYISYVSKFKKRNCFKDISDYIYGDTDGRVLILYGLRRTGKTTLIRQTIYEMSPEIFSKSAFIQIKEKDTISGLNSDLRYLQKEGYKYIFIDEVTLMDDFIQGAALFSDIYATCGMKIVLSGTDSLGFVFSENNSLYDRCFMIHSTFIPFREFSRVLGIDDLDEYIRFGGTMSVSGKEYNSYSLPFSDKNKSSQYVDSAIAANIQHSLKNYDYENHFGSLKALYENNELTSAVNRVVEDINHRFTIRVLTKDFYSSDLEISSRNLLTDRSDPDDTLTLVDKEEIRQKLKTVFDIKDKAEQKVSISQIQCDEIKEYLDLLDLTADIKILFSDAGKTQETRTVITQPGLRYSQAKALIEALADDSVFAAISASDKKKITDRILSEIKGRMLEDIILLETMIAEKDKNVFKLIFKTGEFDMVIQDPENLTCEIFEIKHSKERHPNQYRHLIDPAKCEETEFRFGKIVRKIVLYRGETCVENNIEYLNTDEYLKSLN